MSDVYEEFKKETLDNLLKDYKDPAPYLEKLEEILQLEKDEYNVDNVRKNYYVVTSKEFDTITFLRRMKHATEEEIKKQLWLNKLTEKLMKDPEVFFDGEHFYCNG